MTLDALKSHRLGADGWDSVWLETHGGAALDALIAVAEAAQDRVNLLERAALNATRAFKVNDPSTETLMAVLNATALKAG